MLFIYVRQNIISSATVKKNRTAAKRLVDLNPQFDILISGGDNMSTDIINKVPLSEIKNDLSKVTKLADKMGSAVILENDSPKYVIINISKYTENVSDFDKISNRILNENMQAFQELAK